MSIAYARNILAALWWAAGLAIFVALFLTDTFNDSFGDHTQTVISWTIPLIVPTLMMIAGVLSATNRDDQFRRAAADKLFFSITTLASAVYLICLALLLMALVLDLRDTPTEQDVQNALARLDSGSMWMGIFQGLAGGTLAYFFTKRETLEDPGNGAPMGPMTN